MLQYDVTEPAFFVADFDSFYINRDTANCITNPCQLLDADCTTPYSGSFLTFGTAADKWAIKASRTHIPGYVEKVCYKCSNPLQDIAYPYEIELIKADCNVTNSTAVP